MEPDWDVLIVGRSFAGLSAALNLGRTRRSVLVVGTGGPRNEAVAHAHGLITTDGAAPTDLVAAAERELLKYPTVEVADAQVLEIAAADGGFRALLGARPTTASRLVLATGVNDDPPAVPGLADHWGRGVFTCPFCDGFEHADSPLGVLGTPGHVAHVARLLTGWSDRVTAFEPALDPAAAADLVAHGVTVEDRAVARVIGDGTRLTGVELADGTALELGALFVARLPVPNHRLAIGLGCAVDDNGFVVVDPMRRTTVPGVWAVGDVTSMRANMALAIADGVTAALDCYAEMFERDWAAAR